MAINLVTFAAQTVTPQDDALIYESALTGSGMIYGGTVTIKSANVLRVAEGHGALCGRKFTIEAMDVPIELTPSGSLLGRIYIHMDLADTDEPISIRVETASSLTPVIQDTDVNINNGVYEINLATFTVNTSTISNLVNVAPDLQTTQELSKQVSNSGDAYSPNKAYKVGDLAIHDNKLYRCTMACSAAAWSVNQSCFTLDTLSNAVTSLNTRLTAINIIYQSNLNEAKTIGTGVGCGYIHNLPKGIYLVYTEVGYSKNLSAGARRQVFEGEADLQTNIQILDEFDQYWHSVRSVAILNWQSMRDIYFTAMSSDHTDSFSFASVTCIPINI